MMNIPAITMITTFTIIIFISSTILKINAHYNHHEEPRTNPPELPNYNFIKTHRNLIHDSPTTSPTHYPPLTLSTPLRDDTAAEIESYGNMFDIRTRQKNNISILSLSILTRALDTNVSYAIYTKKGTYRHHQRNTSSWTLLSEGEVIGRGDQSFTPLPPFTPPVSLSPSINDRRAFYVTLTTPDIIYANGTSVGRVHASDDHLEIYQGIGVTLYPFGPVVSPRLWKGEVRYRVEGRTDAPSMVPSGSPSMELFREIFDYEFEVEAFPATEGVLDDISGVVLVRLEVLWGEVGEMGVVDWGGVWNVPMVTVVESTNNYEQSLISTVVTLERDNTITPSEIRYALLSFSKSIAAAINAKYIGPDTLATEKIISLSGRDLATLNRSDVPLFENGLREWLAKSTSSYGEYLDILFVKVKDQALSSSSAASERRRRRRYDRHLEAEAEDEYLDVTVAITGEYYPPPTIDLSIVVDDAIEENSHELVETLRDATPLAHFSHATVVKSTATSTAPSAMPTVMIAAMTPKVKFWDTALAIWVVVGSVALMGSALVVACFLWQTTRNRERNKKLMMSSDENSNAHQNLHGLTRGGVMDC